MEIFKTHDIIPDVIDQVPKMQLSVSYKENSGSFVNLGNELTPSQVKHQPQVEWYADSSKFYTLLMTDPDAPSRKNPIKREWKHWLVVNIPANRLDEGEVKAEYVGAGPPQSSGLHRYVFLLFEQKNGKKDFSELKFISSKNSKRANFNTKDFAEEHSLEIQAGNFFQAQWDDYVPTLYKQFTE